MKNAECKNCKYYEVDSQNLKQGYCHYNPPTAMPMIQPMPGGGAMQGWHSSHVPVKGDNWCGRHEPKMKVVQQ